MRGGLCRGFTLVEVALAMAVIAISVLLLASYLPSVIRAEGQARFRSYAAVKSMEVVTAFATRPVTYRNATVECRDYPWETTSGSRSFAPDLENSLEQWGSAAAPLPRVIAERLDSAGDEIRRHLEAGGNLYYAKPGLSIGLMTHGIQRQQPPNELQLLVFAVVGHAQQNAIPFFPWKAWPYYAPYPSPPMGNYGRGSARSNDPWHWPWECDGDPEARYLIEVSLGNEASILRQNPTGNPQRRAGWRDLAGPAVDLGWQNNKQEHAGYVPYLGYGYAGWGAWLNSKTDKRAYMIAQGRPAWVIAKYYAAFAWWYAQRKVEQLVARGDNASADILRRFILGTWTEDDVQRGSQVGEIVNSMRYLAHASMTLTKWYSLEANPGLPAVTDAVSNLDLPAMPAHPGLSAGIRVPGRKADLKDGPGVKRLVDSSDMVPPSATLVYDWPVSIQDLLENNSDIPLLDPAAYADPFCVADPAGVDADDPGGPQWVVTYDLIAGYHRASLALGMRAATENPYDFAALRPLNRMLMTDFPLIQWDVIADSGSARPPFSAVPSTIPWLARDPVLAPELSDSDHRFSAWRPIAARDLTHVGYGQSRRESVFYDPGIASLDWNRLKGDQNHFNLTARFEPAERCRQIVFWMVDWQSYRDVETAPSAPLDASRYPFIAQGMVGPWSDARQATMSGGLMGDLPTGARTWRWKEYYQPTYRNPEHSYSFIRDMNDPADRLATGTNVLQWIPGLDLDRVDGGRWDTGIYQIPPQDPYRADQGYAANGNMRNGQPKPSPRSIFNGIWGGDRNGNQLLDRGPISPDVRMRAVEVGRYNFYDPRLVMTSR